MAALEQKVAPSLAPGIPSATAGQGAALAGLDTAYAPTVAMGAAGLFITNGAISVTNPGSTVIIDGTSDMFRIAATGTMNAPAAAAYTEEIGSTEVATGLAYNPAHYVFLTSSASMLPNVDAYVATATFRSPVILAWVDVVNTDDTRVRIVSQNVTANSISTDPVRYYILQQASI
jgi:hypothetical protein